MRSSIRPLDGAPRGAEAGFTLVEALVAILVLVIGIMGIANLFAIAASSNAVANQGTAATTSAMQTLERLRATSYPDLVAPMAGAAAAGDLDTASCANGTFSRCDAIPGVGFLSTHWQLRRVTPDLVHITVRAEGTGALSRGRSRAEFTTFRSCTAGGAYGCP